MVKPIASLFDTTFGQLQSGSSKTTTICLESQDAKDVFILVRVYDKKAADEKVLLTVTVEMPEYDRQVFHFIVI